MIDVAVFLGSDITSEANTGVINVDVSYRVGLGAPIDCGLCGTFNGDDTDDYHYIDTQTVGRRNRNLLATIRNLETIDGTGIGDWDAMLNDEDVWRRTHEFGDAWIVNTNSPTGETDLSTIFFPTSECVNIIRDHCTTAWNNEDSCTNCREFNNGVASVTMDDFVHNCIYDTCAAIKAGGIIADDDELSLYEYETLIEDGYFDMSLGTCRLSCDLYRECPAECSENVLEFGECDCTFDENCRSCQSHGHCSQCNDGYFRKTDRHHECYPCQDYAGEGCMFCQDFNGCGQCKEGFTRVFDDDCGLWYCR